MPKFVHAFILLGLTCFPSKEEERRLPNLGAPPQGDSLFSVALRYAPFIYHATDRDAGRQDLISNIDFDGDLVGNNNWENFDRFELKPTVYYAVLQTSTHYFIAYHLFHPRDWNHFTLYVHDTHENDGENLQVVIRKMDGKVILLWTQAHYRSNVYTNPGSGVSGGSRKISGRFQLVNDAGIPDSNGTHAAVFVEAQGHGIYGTLDSGSEMQLQPNGSYVFRDRSGILFRPAKPSEPVNEPQPYTSGEVPYQLDSISEKLWPLLRDGLLVGNGKLLDGAWRYTDELMDVSVPRFYDADRFSGPFGPDRGISPFALDFVWCKGTLGALFFNPARRYAEQLTIEGDWSRFYLHYPFH
jgi:hypothetical protein